MNTGLTSKEQREIQDVFSRYHDIEKVLIYGSRAMGNYKPSSDIDLTLIGENITLDLLFKIEMDLDNLLLPYKFDISVYHRISDPDFLEHIDRVGVPFYLKK